MRLASLTLTMALTAMLLGCDDMTGTDETTTTPGAAVDATPATDPAAVDTTATPPGYGGANYVEPSETPTGTAEVPNPQSLPLDADNDPQVVNNPPDAAAAGGEESAGEAVEEVTNE